MICPCNRSISSKPSNYTILLSSHRSGLSFVLILKLCRELGSRGRFKMVLWSKCIDAIRIQILLMLHHQQMAHPNQSELFKTDWQSFTKETTYQQ